MEIVLTCPNDGDVEVTIDDVASVVLHGSELVEVVFDCPMCGEPLSVKASVPSLLAAAIEALQADDDLERRLAGFFVVAGEPSAVEVLEMPGAEDGAERRIEAYCEYFRRELETVSCAEDAISEIDSR